MMSWNHGRENKQPWRLPPKPRSELEAGWPFICISMRNLITAQHSEATAQWGATEAGAVRYENTSEKQIKDGWGKEASEANNQQVFPADYGGITGTKHIENTGELLEILRPLTTIHSGHQNCKIIIDPWYMSQWGNYKSLLGNRCRVV